MVCFHFDNCYYMVLNFYDKHTGKRTPKWFPTGLCVKGNKRQAEQVLLDTLAKYPDRSYDATADTLFSDWGQMWLDSAKTYVRTSTLPMVRGIKKQEN